ncbi:MAG: MBL fold metallo-hydrolase [Isosphaeraceae bacterium]
MADGAVPGSRRKAWKLGSLAALALVLVAVAAWGVSRLEGRAGLRPRPLERQAMTVVPGVWMLGGLSPSAAYVVDTGDGLILFDSGLEADAGPLRAQMAELGLDWRRIRAIFLTHAHGDHTGGAEALRAETGAKVHAGAGDAGVLKDGKPREAFFSTFAMHGWTTHPTTIDVPLHGGETFDIGDTRIEAIATPGHTPGSTCYLVERRGVRALFSGDVIMMLRGDDRPRNELDKPLGTYSAYLPPCYRGEARKSLESLRVLRRLPVPDLVLPGHPGSDRTPQSPRLSSSRWEEMLDRGIRDMETLIARYEADGPDFLDGAPKRLRDDLDYLGDLGGRSVYGFRAGERYVLVDAPGGAGLVAFVRARLRELGRDGTSPSAVLLTACGPGETLGLRAAIEAWHPQVVAAREGIAGLRSTCPPGTEILPADELTGDGRLPVVPVQVAGRGVAPAAYRVTIGGKAVLISGRIPVKIGQESGEGLIADLMAPPGDVRGYFATMIRLHEAAPPDLWLPSTPTHGQNANLYDHQWKNEIEQNLLIVRTVVSNLQRR